MTLAKDNSLEKAQVIIKKLTQEVYSIIIKSYNPQCEKSQKQLLNYEEQISTLKQQSRSLKNENLQQQKQNNEQNTMLKQIEKLTEQLKDKERLYDQALIQSQKMINSDKQKLYEVTQEFQSLQNQHKVLADHFSKQESKHDEATHQLVDFQTQLIQLDSEHKSILKQMQQLKEDYEQKLKEKQQEIQMVQDQAKNQIRSIIQQQQAQQEILPFASAREYIFNQTQPQRINNALAGNNQKNQKSNDVLKKAILIDKEMSKINKENRSQSRGATANKGKKSVKRNELPNEKSDVGGVQIQESVKEKKQKKLRFQSPEKIIEELPEADIRNSVTPLILWLKKQLQKAWEREFKVKTFIQNLSSMQQPKLEYQLKELNKQFAKIRGEVEMWQMRGEDLETQLLRWQQKCWSIKQITLEQQRMIKALKMEREELFENQKKFKRQAESSYSFTKYECNKYESVVSQFKIISDTIESFRVQTNQYEELKTRERSLINDLDQQQLLIRQLKFDHENAIRELMDLKEKQTLYKTTHDSENEKTQYAFSIIMKKLKINDLTSSHAYSFKEKITEDLDKILLNLDYIDHQDKQLTYKIQDLERQLSDQREKFEIEQSTLKVRMDKLQDVNNLLKEESDKNNDRLATEAYENQKRLETENEDLNHQIQWFKETYQQRLDKVLEYDDSIDRDLDQYRDQECVFAGQSNYRSRSNSQNRTNIGPQPSQSFEKRHAPLRNVSKDYSIQQMQFLEKQRNDLIMQAFSVIKDQIFDLVAQMRQSSFEVTSVHSKCDQFMKELMRDSHPQQSYHNNQPQDPFDKFFKISQDFLYLIKDYIEDHSQAIKQQQEIEEQKDYQRQLQEAEFKRRIAQVLQVLKSSSLKAGKADRDLQELFDYQTYMIEEISNKLFNKDLTKSQNANLFIDSLAEDQQKFQQNMIHLIGDFNYTLDRLLQNLRGLQELEPSKESIEEPINILQKSQQSSVIVIKEELMRIYEKSHKVLENGFQLHGVALYINSQDELQRHSFRIIKNLKEHFTKIKGSFVKKMNQDIDYYINQKQNQSELQFVSSEQYRQIINKLRQEILELKQNEQFLKKLTEEIECLKESLDNFDIELIEQCLVNKNIDFLKSPMTYQILSEQIGSVMREAKSIKDDSQDENSKIRRNLSKVIFDLVLENSKFRKLLNKLNKIIKYL
ncbi:UNKNOWN [Stylonychia lemnae]|uniref:Uncharacterized protein n=1 Tax=Stylonychia lemnae TaxID=5949 RepID=A0A078ANJ6_STYLE|nr:UNKNOWN [Stylonychia lemnae]|eukprot:CDW82877.1 UNKNOWN [Stylonychia lemnae]